MTRVLAVVVFGMIAIPAFSDIRSRDFPVLPPLLLFLAGLIIKIAGNLSLEDLMAFSAEGTGEWGWLPGRELLTGLLRECAWMTAGSIPGAVFFILHKLSPQGVGEGDVLLVLLLGILCGFTRTLFTCLSALTLIGVCGIACSIRSKIWKNLTLPFLPFLLAGYIFSVLCMRD